MFRSATTLLRIVQAVLFATALMSAPVLTGQAAKAPHAPLSTKYCHPTAGFCFRYPSWWTLLGEVFDGNGVVVAPQQKEEQALWDVITVAMVAPSSENSTAAMDGVIEHATAAMRDATQDFETLQRQDRTVDQNPAQMLKTRYRENAGARDWVEELVFIQGPQNEVYSVSLKCAPDHLARLEPVLKQVLATWKLQAEEPPSSSATPLERAPH